MSIIFRKKASVIIIGLGNIIVSPTRILFTHVFFSNAYRPNDNITENTV